MTQPAPQAAAHFLALIREVIAAQPAAIDAWFRSEHPAVYRLCFGFLADAEEAEDVAQDAMLHLLDKLTAWDQKRSYQTWRDTVVLNQCRDRLRRRAARVHAEGGAAERVARESGSLPDAGNPAGPAEREEVREALRASLAALTPREREVFVLRDLEGRSTSEAARLLSVQEGTIRSLLTLARRRLRTLLGSRLAGVVPEGGGHA